MQSTTTVYVAPTATAATAVLLSNATSQTAPGEYTFVQPKRGCCDSQRVVMTVNVCEGQVTHHVTSGTACCDNCQDRFLRESDVNSIVSVNTYMLSQAGRITRIVLGLLFFSSMFSTGVYMLCASGNGVSDSAPAAADAVAETARRVLSYTNYYRNYYYPSGPSIDAGFGIPFGSVMLAISLLLLLSAVAAWFACCLRLHQLTVILKSGGLPHHGTMSIWLSPDQVTELAAVIKTARAAHHHTRLGADRDSIVAIAQAASQELRNRRAYVPAPAPVAVSYPQQQQQRPTATVTGEQLQNPVMAQYQPPRQQ